MGFLREAGALNEIGAKQRDIELTLAWIIGRVGISRY